MHTVFCFARRVPPIGLANSARTSCRSAWLFLPRLFKIFSPSLQGSVWRSDLAAEIERTTNMCKCCRSWNFLFILLLFAPVCNSIPVRSLSSLYFFSMDVRINKRTEITFFGLGMLVELICRRRLETVCIWLVVDRFLLRHDGGCLLTEPSFYMRVVLYEYNAC